MSAQMLRLSSAQEEQLLQLRKKHLRNLRNLYEDRQRLNLSVRATQNCVSAWPFLCSSGRVPPLSASDELDCM